MFDVQTAGKLSYSKAIRFVPSLARDIYASSTGGKCVGILIATIHSSFSSFPKSELKTRRKYIVEVRNSITTAILEIVGWYSLFTVRMCIKEIQFVFFALISMSSSWVFRGIDVPRTRNVLQHESRQHLSYCVHTVQKLLLRGVCTFFIGLICVPVDTRSETSQDCGY